MKLLVHELKTTLSQTIETQANDLRLKAIRPKIYKHNAPSGSLKLSILDNSERLIAESNTILISSISAVSFYHGYISFEIDCTLKKNTNYIVRLSHLGGYSFSEGAYIGWCNDFDLRKVTADWSPNVGFSAALDLEIWIQENISKGIR